MRIIPRKDLVTLLKKYTTENELLTSSTLDDFFNRYGDEYIIKDGEWKLIIKNNHREHVIRNIHEENEITMKSLIEENEKQGRQIIGLKQQVKNFKDREAKRYNTYSGSKQ